jgi:hypothetical protein
VTAIYTCCSTGDGRNSGVGHQHRKSGYAARKKKKRGYTVCLSGYAEEEEEEEEGLQGVFKQLRRNRLVEQNTQANNTNTAHSPATAYARGRCNSHALATGNAPWMHASCTWRLI